MPYIQNKKKKEFAKHLRRCVTWEENYLWQNFLRNHQSKFRRQHLCHGYVLDFYCYEFKLAVELDGGHHYDPIEAEKDAMRTSVLNSYGITVLRIDNYFVRDMFDFACEMIDEKIAEISAGLV